VVPFIEEKKTISRFKKFETSKIVLSQLKKWQSLEERPPSYPFEGRRLTNLRIEPPGSAWLHEKDGVSVGLGQLQVGRHLPPLHVGVVHNYQILHSVLEAELNLMLRIKFVNYVFR